MNTDKKKIDIEKALQWTIRDEMPKGQPVSKSAWDTVISYSRLGARVSVSQGGGGDGLGFLHGEPHPDAVKIARAVADLPAGIALSADDCAALVGHYAALDRAAVAAVWRASFNPSLLIIGHASNRSRPVWNIGAPQPRGVRHSNGNGIVFGDDGEGGVVRMQRSDGNPYRLTQRPRCFLQYAEPSIVELIESRVEYTIWHRMLCDLACDLADRLDAHAILPPAAAPAPWLSGEVETVVHTGEAVKLSALPLKPARGRAPRPHESAIEREDRESRSAARRSRRGSPQAEGGLALRGGGF